MAHGNVPPAPAPFTDPSGPCVEQYFGKYRGMVLDNIDPERLGRILPEVPSVPGMLLNWALPCFPYAGPEVGFFAVPPIGATVWIEFERGDPKYPIWSGCFWSDPLEVPPSAFGIPEVKGMVTDFITMLWNDAPVEGGFTLMLHEPVAPTVTTVLCNEEGVSILVPPAAISILPEAVTVAIEPATVSITPALISVDLPDTLIEISEAGVVVTANELAITGDVNITGAVNIEGNMEIVGAVEIEGDVNVVGAVEFELDLTVGGASEFVGAVDVGGAVAIEGAVNLAGVLAVEGATNIAGSLTVEGNEAVVGVIEGVVVPPI